MWVERGMSSIAERTISTAGAETMSSRGSSSERADSRLVVVEAAERAGEACAVETEELDEIEGGTTAEVAAEVAVGYPSNVKVDKAFGDSFVNMCSPKGVVRSVSWNSRGTRRVVWGWSSRC